MKKRTLSAIAVASITCFVAVSAAVYTNAFDSDQNVDTPATEAAISLQDVPEEPTAESAETAIRTLAAPAAPETVTKDDIFHMMLNSIDYYDQVSGTIYFPNAQDLQIINSIQFECSLSETTAHKQYTQTQTESPVNAVTADAVETVAANNTSIIFEEEAYCTKDVSVTIDPLTATYENNAFDAISLEEVSDIPDEERITTASDGQPCYSYRTNPTNVPEASISIFPQEMAFGFLSDFSLWNMDAVTEWNGRTCYSISGTTTEAYGGKLNVASFTFLVDANTGVLLQYIGYDADGKISDYLYTENIQFDENAAAIPAFSVAVLSGYTERTTTD